MEMVDPKRVAVYGSDAAEFCEAAACLRQMMTDDFRLWRTARFGAMSEVTVRRDGRLATVFFQVPFSAGGSSAVPVRVSLVWRRRGDQWLLTQASNVVPTTGSSARQILSARPANPPATGAP